MGLLQFLHILKDSLFNMRLPFPFRLWCSVLGVVRLIVNLFFDENSGLVESLVNKTITSTEDIYMY